MFKRLAMFYQKGVSMSLLKALALEEQPPIQATFSKFNQTTSVYTSKQIKNKYPDLVDILKDPDIEITKGDENGNMIPNSDLGILEGGHYKYLFNAFWGIAHVSKPAEKKHENKPTQLKKTLFGADTYMSPLKLIALLKASHLGELGAMGQENAVLCGSGHWVRVNELQGDHAFAQQFLGVFFMFFEKAMTFQMLTIH